MTRLRTTMELLVGALVIAVVVVVSMQVFSRYVLNAAFDWTEEASRLAFVYLTFIGAALATAYRRQLKVDAVTMILPGRKRHALVLASDLLSIAFWAVVLYFSWTLLQSVHRMSLAVTQFPSSIAYLPVPIGALLLEVYLIRDAFAQARALAGVRRGDR